ncbi:MAG: DUF2000 domain-containing protein [Candidatus Levybacteria bacterium]|nr:DUF2000 domain-containing protein [Candidatus Levybacteria bacterium]
MKVSDDFKMVIVLDEKLPIGLLVNTAAVLSLTLGEKIQGLIDKDLMDGSGLKHMGLTNTPLPILKSSEEKIKSIKTYKTSEDLLIVDITDAAQTTKNYIDYEEKLKSKTVEELKFLGIAVAGSKKTINSITGNFSLLK